MLLPFSDSLVVTTHFDGEMSMLADRHYSRRTVGARQFLYNGRKIVIRNTEGTILFGWMWPQASMRMDGQSGYSCAIFRNESDRKSSDVILECERIAVDRWGPNRMYTYVDPRKTLTIKRRGERVVGFCFIKAGWKFVRLSKGGLHLLVKECGRSASGDAAGRELSTSGESGSSPESRSTFAEWYADWEQEGD